MKKYTINTTYNWYTLIHINRYKKDIKEEKNQKDYKTKIQRYVAIETT